MYFKTVREQPDTDETRKRGQVLRRNCLISFEVYATIMVPILIAARFPAFAGARSNGTPPLAFPILAGLAAAAIGVVAHTLVFSIGHASLFEPARGWSQYANRSYPWSFLLFLIAGLIAWSMRIGSYAAPGRSRALDPSEIP